MGSNERIIPRSFEEQFSNISKLQFGAGEVSVCDIFPIQNLGKLPVLFVVGWEAKIQAYKSAIKSMVEAGRRVISVEPYGTEEEKSQEMIEILDNKKISEIDSAAHSVGSMSLMEMAMQIPGRVKHIVVFNPPTGVKSRGDLIRRYKSMLENAGKAQEGAIGSGRRIRDMAKLITEFDIESVSQKLQSLGVPVARIHGLYDTLFSPPDADEAQNVLSLPGGHMQVDPFIQTALNFLER